MAEDKGQQLPPGLKAAIEAIAKVPNIKPIAFPTIDLSGFAKAHADALAVFPEMQRQFAAQSKPMADLQKQLANIRLPSDEVIQQMAEVAKRMQSLFANLPRPSPEQIRIFEQVSKADRRKKALDRTGVLPHASTPFALLDGEESDDDLRALLERHYREKWSGVSQDTVV